MSELVVSIGNDLAGIMKKGMFSEAGLALSDDLTAGVDAVSMAVRSARQCEIEHAVVGCRLGMAGAGQSGKCGAEACCWAGMCGGRRVLAGQ